MAVEQNPKLAAAGRRPGVPVLVPQESLAGQPDVPLDRPVTTVGSNDTARLHLVSRTVSKGHALLVNSGGVIYIADLASRTGVLVNGKLVRDADLKNGDRIQIGKFVFRYRVATPAPATPAPMPPAASVIVVGLPPKPIEGRVFQIGRRETSDVAFPTDSAVSSAHAVIFEMNGRWHIRDLGSRTGTLVNGKPVHQQMLNFGDRVVIGESTILFQPGAPAAVEEADDFDSVDEEPAPIAIEDDPDDLQSPPVESDDDTIPLADVASIKAEPIPEAPVEIPLAEVPVASAPTATEPSVESAIGDLGLDDWFNDKEEAAAQPPIPLELESPEVIDEVIDESVETPIEEIALAETPVAEPAAIEMPSADLEPIPLEDEPLALEPVETVPTAAIEFQAEPSEPPPLETAAIISPDATAPVEERAEAIELDPLPVEPAPSETAPLESIPVEAVEPEPAPSAPAAVTAEPVSAPVVEPAASRVSLPPGVIEPIEDFVFVPVDEKADPNALPDVLFWGDDELDTAAEQAITQPPPAVIDVQPPAQEISALQVDAPASGADAELAAPPAAIAPADEPLPTPADETPAATEPLPLAPEEIQTADELAVNEASPPDASDEVQADVLAIADETGEPAIESESVGTVDHQPPSQPVPESGAVDEPLPPAFELDSAADQADEFASVDLEEAPIEIEQPIEQPVDQPLEPSVEQAIDEPVDFEDLEFLDSPEPITAGEPNVEPPSEFSGVHTVDELPPDDRITLTEEVMPPPVITPPVVDAPGAVAESNESDLEFLDFDVAPSGPESTPEPENQAPPAGGTPAAGPSVFGFQFEDGSFLGGMPISLLPDQPLAPVNPAESAAPVFDASTQRPSGLGSTNAVVQPPVSATPETSAETAAKPIVPPLTPPRPQLSTSAAIATPTSLSGLIRDAHMPWAAPPVIPPTQKKSSPKSKGAKAGGAVPARSLTGTLNAPGSAPRTAEVFSQMAAPIGVEVFGGPAGDPNQFTVPEVDKNNPAAADLAAAALPVVADAQSKPRLGALPPKRKRRSWLPLYLILAVLVPAAIVAAVYRFVPVSSMVVGSVDYDLLLSQSAGDVHAFHLDQAARIRSEPVRKEARDILDRANLSEGFTSDPDTYQSIVGDLSLNWNQSKLEFTYNTADESLGAAQVNAVMAALVKNDQDLQQAHDNTATAAKIANQRLKDSTALSEELTREWREQLDKAQDFPQVSLVIAAEQKADQFKQQWMAANAARQSSEKVLADIRAIDPAKPLDPQADPDVIKIKKQLQPLLDQIGQLRGTGAVNAGSPAVIGTDVPVGATTQPDTDTNPLVVTLQKQADVLSARLKERISEINAENALGTDQRAVNQAQLLENLSIKINSLKAQEADAKTAYDTAKAKADQYKAETTAAHMAGLKAQELHTQQMDADVEQQSARAELREKELLLARCVTVRATPSVNVVSRTDMRPKLAGGGVLGSLLFLGLLIFGELRRPKLITGVAPPAAAPRVTQPVRKVVWPAAEEIAGLDQTNPTDAVMSDSQQTMQV